jgi:signal transduction histidine kinase
MKLPAFVAEMGREEARAKLQAGIWTGYATAIFFGLIAFYAAARGVIPDSPAWMVLVGAKLVTNTLSWATLRSATLRLPFASLNITADLLVMTAIVYLTGGPSSPLLPVYFIEVAVMALLTNLGLTIVTILASFILFAIMCGLIQAGALPLVLTPAERAGRLNPAYVATVVAAYAVCTLAPGAYIALIVQRLRDKEAALERHARDLVQAAREKSQFMVNVTHELRTPLHGILGLTDLLREGVYGPVTDPQKDGFAGIETSAKSLLELIDSLLLLARSEASKLEVVRAPVSLGEIVSSVAATGRWMRGRKELTLEVTVAPDLPEVSTDRAKVAQILVNLLANAIKFTPEGGHVAIDARREGAAVAIAVRDTGIGIPEAELPRIFEEFHQVDGSASRRYGGAGLGLALARRLARALQGDVSVESAEGKGSTFTVTLPIDVQGAQA